MIHFAAYFEYADALLSPAEFRPILLLNLFEQMICRPTARTLCDALHRAKHRSTMLRAVFRNIDFGRYGVGYPK